MWRLTRATLHCTLAPVPSHCAPQLWACIHRPFTWGTTEHPMRGRFVADYCEGTLYRVQTVRCSLAPLLARAREPTAISRQVIHRKRASGSPHPCTIRRSTDLDHHERQPIHVLNPCGSDRHGTHILHYLLLPFRPEDSPGSRLYCAGVFNLPHKRCPDPSSLVSRNRKHPRRVSLGW